jgi:thiol-disulfide isomerase/thioredoxin
MLLLFALEFRNFFGDAPTMNLSLEASTGKKMQINFDVEMYDIECRNLRVAVMDPLGKEVVQSSSRSIKLTAVDMQGREGGLHRELMGPEEAEELEAAHTLTATKLETEDGKGELDSDWASSHDGFKHQHFDHVIEYHDYTVVNFFAEWCSHCRMFSPLWGQIAEAINQTNYTDHGGHVREVKALKMNCVDFRNLCREKGIDEFPTIRIFRSDGSSSRFEGRRSQEAILNWVETSMNMKADGWARDHKELQTGCRAQGHLQVPRIPGYLEFFAGAGSHALDPTLTNVSHHVRHLSFEDPARRNLFGLFGSAWFFPSEVRRHISPLDGQQFCTHKFHESFEHHLMLVETSTDSAQTYQFAHYNRVSTTSNKSEVPQAKFNFDLESFAVKIENEVKQWYDFATSTMAILGGTFAVAKLVATGSRNAARVAVRSTQKKRIRPGM